MRPLREFARCTVWTLGLGGLALLIAMFTSAGLAQAEGPWAWFVFAVYSPFYLLAHASGSTAIDARSHGLLLPAAVIAQFAYFFAAVASVRYLHRMRKRAKR